MYECMVFAYSRLTGQKKMISFSIVKKFLFEKYLTSESMEVLEGAFQFRRLIEEVEINHVTRQLFMRFECDVFTSKEKPSIFMLDGLARYDKHQSQRIFSMIKKVHQQKDYTHVEQNEFHKKQRLQSRRLSVMSYMQEEKQKHLQKSKQFRIKNRSYSWRNLDGYRTKMIYNGPVDLSRDKGNNALYSTTTGLKIFNQQPHGMNSKKLSTFTTSLKSQTLRELTQRKLTQGKVQPVRLKKPRSVVFIGGKAYTKSDFFQTIQYFNSLSNNKQEIKIKQFFKTFQNKTFLKRQLYSLFIFFDKQMFLIIINRNLNGQISFQEFIKRMYPNIDKKFFQKLKQWNIDYKNIYQADKIFIKKEKKQTKIQLPEDAKLRVQEIFRSFGGQKGYLMFEDIRIAYQTGFSMQECENIMRDFGVDGKIYIDGFARMLLPEGYVIENCDWHIKKTPQNINFIDASQK